MKPWIQRQGQLLLRLAHEPLLQFVIVGAALFGANHLLRDSSGVVEEKRIELTPNDIRQLGVAWLAQGRPAPSPAQLKSLVDQKVAMEILVREAKELGLDQEDEVIKRRLAQKMDFLFEDVANAREPTEAELRDWFSRNAGQFRSSPRLDFHHLYFALDRGRTAEEVEKIKARIAGNQGQSAIELAGADQFMFQDSYADAPPDQVAKTFGPDFANAVFNLPKGSWQGPIQSGYGLHLVHVDALVPAASPRFEEVQPQVKVAWIEEQSRAIKKQAFDRLKERYTVVTPPLDDAKLITPGRADESPSP